MGMNDAPALALAKPDGSVLNRVEAEKELWDKCKTSHTMRRLAWGQFGLDNRYTWMLKPTSITHWILDEMIRKRMIAGDPIGVQPELESDDSYFNSFIQRLKVFVEDGRAMLPKEGEGIDMENFNQGAPPPMNGQPTNMPGYAPPPPPPMGYPAPQGQPQQFQQQPPPPSQYAAPPPPPAQYGAPPAVPGYPAPQGQQQMQFGQQAPQFGQQAPQVASPFPPQGPPPPIGQPQMPPQGMPQAAPQGMMTGPAQGAPPPAPPATSPSNRRGRGKSAEAAPQAAPPQQNFNTPPQGMMPPQGMPQFGQQVAQAPQGGGSDALQAQVAELKGIIAQQAQQIAQILHMVKGVDAAVSILIRPYYEKGLPQQPQQLGTEATFKECQLPYPQ